MIRLTLVVIVSLTWARSEGWAQQNTSPSTHVAAPTNPQSAIRNPQSTVIDRLVVVVNEAPITESDLLWFLALDAEVPAGPFTDELKRSALRQFIDQELLYQEAEKLPSIEVKPDEIDQYISELIKRFPSESVFGRRLDAVGLDQTTLQQIVQRRLVILQFIEFRFRAFVFVTDQEIQSYYESRVLPLAQERGQTPPPLEQIKDLIEKNLIEDRVASELTLWFEDARRRADIVYLVHESMNQ
jgi:hypothetical protein